ncbi:hypothetical protein KKF84_21445 [Myxococcota bacterium]|nr:hypothetical protein [Myxococcota bacterium]MBU1537891.1 hypothetical protein [Myxococcota bacterium]
MKQLSILLILVVGIFGCKKSEEKSAGGTSDHPKKSTVSPMDNTLTQTGKPVMTVAPVMKPASVSQGPAVPPAAMANGPAKPLSPMHQGAPGVFKVSVPKKAPTRGQIMKFVQHNNLFAMRYLRGSGKKDENVVFSPFSLRWAFSMIYPGAGGITSSEIKRVLEFLSPGGAIHPINRSLGKFLTGKHAGATFTMGSQLKISNMTLGPAYLAFLKKFYGPTVSDGKNARQVLDVISQVHFTGKWAQGFDPLATMDRPFYVKGTSPRQVRTMMATSRFKLAQAGNFDALILPYKGGKFEMVILLPKKRDGVDQLVDALQKKTVGSLSFVTSRVRVLLPRFTISQSVACDATLQKMGVRKAYDERDAEFNAIYPGLYIQKVIQEVKVQVEEKGTRAQAKTTIRMATMGVGDMIGFGPMPRVILFKVDHPFVFMIRDTKYHSVLFLGRITTL